MKLGILLLILSIVVLVLNTFVFYKLMTRPSKYPVPSTMTRQEIILNCQKIAATANDKWNYKNCLDELQKSTGSELRGI